MNDTKSTILMTACHNFEEAARRLELDDFIRQTLKRPRERVELNISPLLPDGQVVNIPVYIVRHNDALGPAKGGVRLSLIHI